MNTGGLNRLGQGSVVSTTVARVLERLDWHRRSPSFGLERNDRICRGGISPRRLDERTPRFDHTTTKEARSPKHIRAVEIDRLVHHILLAF